MVKLFACTHCRESKPADEFYKNGKYRSSWCKQCCINLTKVWYGNNTKIAAAYKIVSKDRLRDQTFKAYGGHCVCCGETNYAFLTIDHIKGGGRKQRNELKRSGVMFYAWLRRQGFPAGYQTLCFNCNSAKHRYGICPHQSTKKLEVVA